MAQESCAIILPQFIAVCVIALRGTDLDALLRNVSRDPLALSN